MKTIDRYRWTNKYTVDGVQVDALCDIRDWARRNALGHVIAVSYQPEKSDDPFLYTVRLLAKGQLTDYLIKWTTPECRVLESQHIYRID